MDRSAKIGALAAAAVGAILLGAKLFDSVERKPRRGGAGYVSDKEWARPTGSAAEMAEAVGVAELIARWKAVPADESKWSVHSEYARALGLAGVGDPDVAEALAPYAVHESPYLRQEAAKALAAIGPVGLDPLIAALQYGAPDDREAGDIRWDAAIALASMGPDAEGAIPALLERVKDFEESIQVRKEAASALANIGEAAREALAQARDAYYKQSQENGLSPSEVQVLRTVNLALAGTKTGGEPEGEEEEEGESEIR